MRALATLGGLVICATSFANITYTVDVHPESNTLHVTIHLPKSASVTKLQLPNWAPGAYVMRNGSATIHNLVAHGSAGQALQISTGVTSQTKKYQDGEIFKETEHPITTWTVAPADQTTVEYDLDNRVTDNSIHWSGPSTYLYAVDRRKEACDLILHVPTGWQAYTGLDENKSSQLAYSAKDYDTLADNPVTAGNSDGLIVDTYLSRGKTCWIVMRGAPRIKVDRAKLSKACKFVTDAETDFFGRSAPFNKYVWHFTVTPAMDGGGGLEHLSSTEITLAQGVGPRTVDVLAHEFFHLWNVKRIRSLPLGPFDYTHLPRTGAIWWLEGVTDYYAYTLLHRYGWSDDAAYLSAAASNFQIVKRNKAFDKVSPNEASMRVDEASNGRGNSNGYLISYYNLGWLAGMCLDIELRAHSQGKHSLDDVELALWSLGKDGKPGFKEDEIRKQLIRFGGGEMGAVYDRIAMQPSMPVEAELAKIGMQVTAKPEPYVDLGYDVGGGPGTAGLTITAVRPSADQVKSGDIILSVNGKSLDGLDPRERAGVYSSAVGKPTIGTPVKLTVKRGDQTLEVEVSPANASRDILSVSSAPNATEEQKKAAAAWLATKKIG